MEQNGANLARGILTGCFIAAIILSLSGKVSAQELIKSPREYADQMAFQQVIKGIYRGARGIHAGDHRLRHVSFEGLSDYFIITGAFRAKSAAYHLAGRNGGRVINTNEYPNLTNGYYAVVFGPFSQLRASREMARRGVRGYIKSGW